MRGAPALLLALALLAPGLARADAAALRERQAALAGALARNDYGRPLHIASSDAGDTLQGEVHALVEHPFASVREALREPARWCEILLLPFNTKYCHAVQERGQPVLLVRIGRKFDQPLDKAYRLAFAFQLEAAQPDYLEAQLAAPVGPVGTRDYRIVLSAVPAGEGRTFLRLRYAYGYGLAGKLALRAYLATAGADKVGFTRVDGVPVGGVRGVIERNAMRYYLAVDAYLESLAAPPPAQVPRRIEGWFDATERYARQLHEMDRESYVRMKLHEHARQQVLID